MIGSTHAVSVLVVDDEADIRFLLNITLTAAGFRVAEASNGEQALRCIEAQRPALVLTDLMMPVMGGRQLIDHLRKDPLTTAIPILVLSGALGEPTAADYSIAKPFHPDELLAAVRRLTNTGVQEGA